ncbi:M23 family metallopeptidase [Streptomyces marincola]|uniref:M23 family metallopeptidase n=1 Tax=Streptomyces marincola TaxID=2878388 RepID=UPI002100050F|nr:M23 family metallopeptidase [Streptomyces marincola]
MSDRLLSEPSGLTDYSGYDSYAAHDVIAPGHGPQEAHAAYDAYDTYAAYGGPAGHHERTGYQQGVHAWDTAAQPTQQHQWYGGDAYAPGGWDGTGHAFPNLHETPAGPDAAYAAAFPAQDAPPAAAPEPPLPGYAGDAPGRDGAGYGKEFGTGQGPDDLGHDPDPGHDPGLGGGAHASRDPARPAEGALVPDEVREEPRYDQADTADIPVTAVPADDADADEDATAGRPQRRGGRRRSARPRRSAFLSVAAPSLAVLGVTAVATAATVNESEPVNETPAPVAAPDPADVRPVAANQRLDSQLAGLTEAVDDYSDRASRTQGRIDLEAQQEAEAEAAAAAAAAAEAARPKFFLPVEQRGLSATFGQSGINWMSTHTGIDFPVSYGTSVRAATDGTISTQFHPSYGTMAILTAPDGTETWYAHLDSTIFTSGTVQAGTVIAYSGNSGTSTGPHLHFEVRPGGGSPVDPLAWLRGKGLEPT